MTKTILSVDPHRDIGIILAEFLGGEGYQITIVRSLQDAILLLSGAKFDLIITEAFEQNDRYRFDPSFLAEFSLLAGNTPIILTSIYPFLETLQAEHLGLAAVLPKPFPLAELAEKIKTVLGKPMTT